jgi:hypothetical protein
MRTKSRVSRSDLFALLREIQEEGASDVRPRRAVIYAVIGRGMPVAYEAECSRVFYEENPSSLTDRNGPSWSQLPQSMGFLRLLFAIRSFLTNQYGRLPR